MSNSQAPQGLIVQRSPNSRIAQVTFALSGKQVTVIGRDPRCDLVLDPKVHGSVSRRHVEIRPVIEFGVCLGWQICDLGSANGTFLNGQRLTGCQVLQRGDRFTLSQNGPEFQFEHEYSDLSTQIDGGLDLYTPATFLTLTQLLPIMSTGKDLMGKAYLVPGIVTVIFVVIMFAALGQPVFFNLALSTYLSAGAYYFVYQLCGKSKPWWVILAAIAITVLMLRSPVLDVFTLVFRDWLPGKLPAGTVNLLTVLTSMFFGAGLMEELLKAIPILAAWAIGLRLRSPWREQVGVWEPLDGILLGTASAVGFTMIETLSLYVPGIVQSVGMQAGNEAIGELTGLQLLIPRVLGSVAGHMSYSGYLGYFIGLSVLKPSRRWQILAVGYFSASLLHAFWNTVALINFWLLVLVGGFSYAFLAAAILKARTFTPKLSKD